VRATPDFFGTWLLRACHIRLPCRGIVWRRTWIAFVAGERARSLGRALLGLPQYWAFAYRCGREAGGGQIFGASPLKSSSGSRDAWHPPLHDFERPKSEGHLRRRLLRKNLRDRERGDRLPGSCRRPSVWRLPPLGGCLGFLVRSFCHTGQRAAGKYVPSCLTPARRKVPSPPIRESTRLLGRPYPHYYNHRQWPKARRCPRDSVVLAPDKWE